MKQKLFSFILILSMLVGLFTSNRSVQPARAAGECFVDSSATTGLNDGTSWGNAHTDLQNALGDSTCTVIRVAAGDYKTDPGNNYFATFTLRSGLQVLGGYPPGGGDDSTRTPGSYETILNGSLAGHENYVEDAMHVVTADGTDSTAVLDGFTIKNGYAFGDGSQYGGGITITDGNPTLSNLIITSNSTNGGGAGIYLLGSSPTITDVTFTGNGGPLGGNLNGGGLFNAGDLIYEPGSPILTRVTFTSNTADYGGGMYSLGGNPQLTEVTFQSDQAGAGGGGLFIYEGTLSLSDSHFDGNDASDGAGIFVSNGTLEMQNTLIENGVTGGFGAGVYVGYNASATIRDSMIKNNTAYTHGGGLYVEGSIAMVGGTISGNSGESGGGGVRLSGTTSAQFINVVIDDNRTDVGGFGGGVFADNSTARFTNLQLTHNSAWQGGGMDLENSDINIVNATIVQNDAAHPGTAIFNDNQLSIANTITYAHAGTSINSATTVTNSFLQDDCPPGATCSGVSTADPKFADPQMISYRLSPTSPAVDAGEVSALPPDFYDVDGDGNLSESIPVDLDGKTRVVLGRVDAGAYEAQVWNSNWTQALELPLVYDGPDQVSGSIDRYLDLPGQSRWFKFAIQPSSKVIVTLTGLPANYDLALYKDISEAYGELNSSQDLLKLSAEFAPDTFSPDTFSPDTFSPDTFSPDTFSPDTFSPDTFSPDTFSPDTFSPDTFSPDTFSPDTFSPDTFSPDTFSPDTFSPDTFSPDTFSPDTFSPDTFSPDTFSSAQTRSLIAVSAHDGVQGEGIIVNTWTKSGYFYVRVRGRNGAYNYDNPFHLTVTLLSGTCGYVSPVLPDSDTSLTADDFRTLILTNINKIEGTADEKSLLQSKLAALAARTSGQVVEVGSDARVFAASQQAQAYPACVYAMNLQAEAAKGIVDSFRELNPDLEYIVLVGNDHAFPFFRYSDSALLASEIDYSPPVLDDTTSQASLKAGYILSQDTYGSAGEVSYKAGSFPIPDLAVGRLVETAANINNLLDAYLGTSNGVVTANNALVTGYDFLADAADAVKDELKASLGEAAVDTLIDENTISPQDPTAWTADELRSSLLGSRHDIDFLAGHFSATSALAADYKTRLTANEVLSSGTNFTNSLVYSAGCHSGYNIVNADDVPGVTEEPDWAQAFAEKGATFIGGTGYQYGDTDFIEYSERLYVEFTKQLRYGNFPVAVGKALVQAKQVYLANTPVMRGIHEKSVLEATLFGLPMLKFDLKMRIPAPVDTSLVTSTTSFIENPGSALGLEYSNLEEVTPTFTDHTLGLDQTAEGGGTTTVDAFYLEGPDGMMVNPAEPVLPLDMLNVTPPEPGFVLRGVGWRGGSFTDLTDILPLTGAATEDLRAPHIPFYSDVFYPVRPWNINYFDALGSSGGSTYLALMPAQYRSTSPGSLTGILRRFDNMDFRLYYSGNIDTYTNTEENWTNTPALSAAPDISHISSSVSPDGRSVSFEIMVTGDPAAGIQEVWIVYTFEDGSQSGTWQPLDLHQDLTLPPDQRDTRLWKGTISLDGASAEDLRFVVQAVNGVGLVTMMTNQGAYYRAGVDPAAPSQGESPVKLAFESPEVSGAYGSQQAFTVLATGDGGSPISGLPITFSLGGMGKLAVTGSDGKAEANFYLAVEPGEYTLQAAFAGNDIHAPVTTSTPFKILQGSSMLVLDPETKNVAAGASAQFTATVKSGNLPVVGKPVALTVGDGSGTQYTGVATTDYAGQAVWTIPGQVMGTYTVTAWFGLRVADNLDLSSAFYMGASDTSTLTVMEGLPDLHVKANDITIFYGDIPNYTFAFEPSDINPSYPPGTDVTGVTCSAGNGPFIPANGPYTINCSNGSSAHYNLVYVPGELHVNPRPLTVSPSPFSITAQYSDPGRSAFTPSYSNWAPGENASVLTTQPTCSTTRTVGSPAGMYDIICSAGAAVNYTFIYQKGTFTVAQEDAYLEYSGNSLALVNNTLNLRATVWDSAAVGYPPTSANPEFKPNATNGDITKMWVKFNIYPESTCGASTTIAPIYARVSDSPTLRDGIGTASATFKSAIEGSYCVVAQLVGGNAGGVNLYYTALDAQSAAVSFYMNSGKFATGGGWIKDPNRIMGSFSFISRYDSKGNPIGQLAYVYRGTYNGTPAVFIIRSSQLTALQFTGTKYPLTVGLQGKCTIQVIRAKGGGWLYSDNAATFKAEAVDTNKTSGVNSDSFALTVWDKNGVTYKTVPTSLLSLGNVIIHLK